MMAVLPGCPGFPAPAAPGRLMDSGDDFWRITGYGYVRDNGQPILAA